LPIWADSQYLHMSVIFCRENVVKYGDELRLPHLASLFVTATNEAF